MHIGTTFELIFRYLSMASPSSFLPIIILGAISLKKVCNGEVHKRLFVFGDSLFDAGNNKYLNGSMRVAQAYYPYGITYHNQSTGRVSDGLVVPDFIGKNYVLVFCPVLYI